MNHRRQQPASPASHDAGLHDTSLKEKFLAVIQSDPLINGVVALGVAVGFFHGWLKTAIASPAVTFLFDGILTLALGLVFLQNKRGATFIPSGPIGSALKLLYGLCLFYLFLPLPDRPPIIISIAAIRGWCFATLMFSLGYRLTKSIPQVKGYYYVLMLLGVITAVYGFRQSPEEIMRRIREDEAFAERYKNTFYASSKGAQLRVFSTFVSSAAFGSTMAYVAVICVTLMTDPKAANKERWLMFVVVCPLVYAMVLSGSRTALVSLAAGFLVIAWQRRNFQNLVVIPGILFGVLMAGVLMTGGQLGERYSTLLNFDQIYGRHSIAVSVGWDFMSNNFLGGGLGRGAYSVPSFLSNMFTYDKYVFCDGDLGRLMIEMGVFGVLVFGHIIFATLKSIHERMEILRGTPAESMALASAACVIMAVISFPSGSPFLGIPMGAMVWFFLGTFARLADDCQAGKFDSPATPDKAPDPPPVTKRFRYIQQAKSYRHTRPAP